MRDCSELGTQTRIKADCLYPPTERAANANCCKLFLKLWETLDYIYIYIYIYILSVLAIHRPFYISICISTLPTQHTTFNLIINSSSEPLVHWLYIVSLSKIICTKIANTNGFYLTVLSMQGLDFTLISWLTFHIRIPNSKYSTNSYDDALF